MNRPLLLAGYCLVYLALWACSPEEVAQTQVPASPPVVIDFATVADFEAFISAEPDQQEAFFAQQAAAGFQSYAQSLPRGEVQAKEAAAPLVDDEWLAQLLNEDGVVKIGPWYCRINAPEQAVYVLPEAAAQHYPALVAQEVEHPDLMVFSTDDEVLLLLETYGTEAVSGRVEGCTSIGGNKDTDNRRLDSPLSYFRQHDTKLQYGAYGVYFRMWMRFELELENFNGGWSEIDPWKNYECQVIRAYWDADLNIKCRGWGEDAGDLPKQYSATYGHTIYYGLRKLSDYSAEAYFTYQFAYDGTTYNRRTSTMVIP